MAFVQDSNPADVQILSVEPGVITLNKGVYSQSLLLCAQHVLPLTVESLDDLTLDHFSPAFAWQPDVMLLGTGLQCQIPSQHFLAHFLKHNIGFEFMDTVAACRTFTALTSEERRVAALLLVDSTPKAIGI